MRLVLAASAPESRTSAQCTLCDLSYVQLQVSKASTAMQCSVFQLHTCTTLHLAHMEILAKFLRPKSAIIISPKANSIAMTSVHYIHASAATFSPTLALGITERAALRGSKQRSKLTNTHSMVRHSSATTDSPSPLSNLPCQTAAPPCSSQKSPYHAL